MTEDELDLLASAYLDGEATSEEVALVERDPELQARVEELRAVSEQLSVTTPPSAQLKEQHLAAALAAFSVAGDGAVDETEDTIVMSDFQGPDTEVMTPPVVDISDRAASADVIDLTGRSREPKHTGPGATGQPSRSVPSWLPVAAALLLLGGGGAWLLSQAGQGDDVAETVADSFEESAEEVTETEAEDTASAEALRSQDDAAAESAPAGADESSIAEEDDAMEDDAMEEEEEAEDEEAVEEEEDASAADDGAGDTDQAAEAGEESGEGGFFPEEPVLFFDSPPTVEEALVDAIDAREDLSLSACVESLQGLTELEPVRYLPVSVAGEPAELFVLLNTDGSETAIVVDIGCTQLTP